MKTELEQGEQILKAGAANLQKKIETVGGKLYLTNHRLIFEARKFNFQSGVTEFQLSSIQHLRPCWTRFLGIIPILPIFVDSMQKKWRRIPFCFIWSSSLGCCY